MTYFQSQQQARSAQLALSSAYQDLAKELGSEKVKVVGGYTLGRVIGEGTFGSVHLGTHRLTSTRCAIKRIPKSMTSQLTREIHHHRALHHPHVLQLYEVIATEQNIWLVSELCTGGELFDYLVEHGRLLESEARRIFGELTVAVGILHRQGTVHRDLKLENVFLDGELRVKLGDLGFAREWRRGNRLLETFCGTTGYASPEMLQGKKYSGEEVDVWSLGIILYTLLCGGLPFDDDDDEVVKSLIIKGEYEEPEWLSNEAKDLIRNILQQDPAKRLSIKSILSHAWFKITLHDPPIDHLIATGSLTPNQASPSMEKTAHNLSTYFASRSPNLLPQMTVTSPLSSPLADEPAGPPSEEESSSQTSFDSQGGDRQHLSSSASVTSTAATTAVEEEEAEAGDELTDLTQRSGDASLTQHSNASETTIRKPIYQQHQPPQRDTAVQIGNKARVQIAEEAFDSEHSDNGPDSRRHSSNYDELSLHLPLAGHSRTPSRTKRRSVSCTVSDRRPSMFHHVSFGADVPPIDFLAQLEEAPPPAFSTTSEKRLLESLSMLGFDIGQITHSVNNNACDASSALWWILRQKQLDREHYHPMAMGESQMSSDSKPLNESRTTDLAPRTIRSTSSALPPTLGSPVHENNWQPEPGVTALQSPDLRQESEIYNQRQKNAPAFVDLIAPAVTKSSSDDSAETAINLPPNGSPSKKRGVEKARTPSFSMLQRATSALTGSALTRKKSEEKMPDPIQQLTPTDTPPKSPKRLLKTPPLSSIIKRDPPTPDDTSRGSAPGKARQNSGDSFQSEKHVAPSTSYGTVSSLATLSSMEHGDSPTKKMGSGGRKESLLNSFRSWWSDGQRKKSTRRAPTTHAQGSGGHVTPTRGAMTSGMRSQHHLAVKRTTVVERRSAYDPARPAYSHRSSSVNSRRSSVTSMHLPHDLGLNRRNSRRSGGSRTPTSEADYGAGGLSRASSVHSLQLVRTPSGPQRHVSRNNSLSQSNLAHTTQDAGKMNARASHSRSSRGSSSPSRRGTTDRAMRSASGAASNRSLNSSRRSSLQADALGLHDSDGESSLRSRQEKHYHPSVFVAHRTSSPLSAGFSHHSHHSHSSHHHGYHRLKPKPPLRDVFARRFGEGDDEWVDDEDGGYAGGLGQASSKGPAVGGRLGAAQDRSGLVQDSPTTKNGTFASALHPRYGRTKPEAEETTAIASPTSSAGRTTIPLPVAEETPAHVGQTIPAHLSRNFSRLPSCRPADVPEEEEEEE